MKRYTMTLLLLLGPIALALAVGQLLGAGFVAQHWGPLVVAGAFAGIVLRIAVSLAHRLGVGATEFVKKPQPLGESGAVMTEFVIVLFPFLMILFGIMQMALVSMARVLVSYAAFTAARAAIVIVPETRGSETPNHINPDLRASDKLNAIRNAAGYAMIPASPPIDAVAQDFANTYAGYLEDKGVGAASNLANEMFGQWVGNIAGTIVGGLATAALDPIRNAILNDLAAINTSGKGESVSRALEAEGWGSDVDGAIGAIQRSLRKFVYARMATMVTLHGEDGGIRYAFKWNDPIRARVTFLFMCRIPVANRFAGRHWYDLGDTTMAAVNTSILSSMSSVGLPGYYLALSADHILVNQGRP